MPLPQATSFSSVAEYLAFERQAECRHEYLDGQIYALAGESLEHSAINANVMIRLGVQLEGKPCRVLSPNMKVRTATEGLYAYPDVSLVCGDPRVHDERRDILINPTVIIEILSPSTEAYDRGEKFLRYRQIETLRDYVPIGQSQPLIEHYERQPDESWVYLAVNDLAGTVSIASIECSLRLIDVYDRITFPAVTPAPAADTLKG
ncbi:MAG: Uma2 family endonuclease [Luteitalea sp.]|nr:Uma2 family endonuclease [Luteitalea sp.]